MILTRRNVWWALVLVLALAVHTAALAVDSSHTLDVTVLRTNDFHDQITYDTQFYVRDSVIDYVDARTPRIAPAVEGRLVFGTP